MANGFIQLPPDSTGKKLDTDELTVGANTVQRQRVLAIPPKASQVPGRTFLHRSASGFNNNSQVYLITSGKTLYVTSLIVTGYNDSSTQGNISVRENGTTGSRRWFFTMPPYAAATNNRPQLMLALSFYEPVQFAGDLTVTCDSGGIQWTLQFTGYEE